VTVDKNTGSNINFYNVQFYNQGLNQYNTYSDLFKNSSFPNLKTSVNELIARGIQKDKIVVAKPATSSDSLNNQGYVNSIDLGSWAQAALKDIGWGAGFCLDFYHHDTNGSNIYNALQYISNQTTTHLIVQVKIQQGLIQQIIPTHLIIVLRVIRQIIKQITHFNKYFKRYFKQHTIVFE
jgi:hypothetical protein